MSIFKRKNRKNINQIRYASELKSRPKKYEDYDEKREYLDDDREY